MTMSLEQCSVEQLQGHFPYPFCPQLRTSKYRVLQSETQKNIELFKFQFSNKEKKISQTQRRCQDCRL